MSDKRVYGVIVRTQGMRNSPSGNPRFRVYLKSGDVYPTEPDASCAYGIENPDVIGHPVEITINSRANITYVRPLDAAWEHSDRGRYVTDQVKLWLENDGQVIDSARKVAAVDGLAGFVEYVSTIVRRQAGAAWHVRQELAENDYGRINWAEIYGEITEEN